MKILFLSSRLPYPPNRGDKLRVFNLLSRLSQKHSITLLSFIESKEQMGFVEELKAYCKRVEVVLLRPWRSYLNCLLHIFSIYPFQLAFYYSREMKKKINSLVKDNKFDAVYVHLFRMAPFAQELKNINKILDLCDAVSLHLKRSIKFKRDLLLPIFLLEWLKIKRYEKKIIEKFDKTVLISDIDKKAICNSDTKLSSKIKIIPNGVDSDYFKPISPDNHKIKKITFLGYLSTFYNSDAVLYFYHKILPIVKKRIPEAKFSIIGASCPEELKKLEKDDSVEIICDAPDTRKILKYSSVFVCPLRVGSGLQNKILEAMSMGLPVVTTKIGYDGIQAKKGEEIFVEDKPEDFAQRVIDLLVDEGLRKTISRNARKFIEDNFQWEESITDMESLLKNNLTTAQGVK